MQGQEPVVPLTFFFVVACLGLSSIVSGVW